MLTWMRSNWKWLAAGAAVGGLLYWRKRRNGSLFGRMDPEVFHCDTVIPPSRSESGAYECFTESDYNRPEAMFKTVDDDGEIRSAAFPPFLRDGYRPAYASLSGIEDDTYSSSHLKSCGAPDWLLYCLRGGGRGKSGHKMYASAQPAFARAKSIF